jgi:hypothetical protein
MKWTSILDHNSEAIVGRTAAACAHPLAAWRVLSTSWKVAVLTVYLGISYLAVLSTLLAL